MNLPEPKQFPYTVKACVCGQRFDYHIGNYNGQLWYDVTSSEKEDGIQHPEFTDLTFMKRNMIKEGDTIFDVGAHQGYYTMVFSKLVGPNGLVVAFEPIPEQINIIQENIVLNNLDNVILQRYAVSDSEMDIKFDLDSQSALVGPDAKTITVKTKTLDAFKKFKPSLLKIDIEGFEYNAIKGAREIINDLTPHIAVEVHSPYLTEKGIKPSVVYNLIDWTKYDAWYIVEGQFVPWNPNIQFTHLTTLFGIKK